ncbi:hypothetical protein [Pseudonocardia lacus]|uniref:hypothetical protein n=1 Tax=Pseudonocardia lacus TaxID=2835865 RepID=UPI001BDC2E3A|nr:hypothetical protein [Pseudonocardia lacus]
MPLAHVDPLPVQADRTVEVAPSAWWESAPVQFGALGLFLIAFGAYPIIAAVRGLRGRGGPPARRRPGCSPAPG